MLRRFNFSYSTYATYKQSQLQFYFMKIAKAKGARSAYQVYGDAGNVVHNAVEDYITDGSITFDDHWEKYDIDSQTGFRGAKLSILRYRDMFEKIKIFVDGLKNLKSVVPEYPINQMFHDMAFKGSIDLFTENDDGEITIYDWKTNSTNSYDMHLDQRRIYAWIIYKITGRIPTCIWLYAEDMVIHQDNFSTFVMDDVEKDIKKFIAEILEKGDDITKYELGNFANPFNDHYNLCLAEKQRREESGVLNINMVIRGHFVFFEGDLPKRLVEGINHKTKFDLPDKYWMQESIRRKGRGYIDLKKVGTIFLYNEKYKCFPIGLMDPITRIIHEYGEYYNKIVNIYLSDHRDVKIMDHRFGKMPERLITDKIMRPYQAEAIMRFLLKKQGILNMATGSGKTFCAADIIRQIDGYTLWICDRKELLEQTRGVIKDLLGQDIGIIQGNNFDLKQVTIATVQSLKSNLDALKGYLYKINTVVVDEYHKSAAESYQKIFAKLCNTKYRLGLTATAFRDDGKTPILNSILGDIVFKISSDELIKQGYLVKPTIRFIPVNTPVSTSVNDDYHDEYKELIVNNFSRNNIIAKLCDNHQGRKILILTKHIEHGRILEKLIPESRHIHGSTRPLNRKMIMDNFRSGHYKILIMTLSIGAEGLDVPDLDVIINAAANKGTVKSLQVLGRVLRLFKAKFDAFYYDFHDCGKYLSEHSEARIKAFKSQGHDVITDIDRNIYI